MALPTGPAVVFLFTDIEGSTRLERALGTAAAALLAEGEAMPIETVVERSWGRRDRWPARRDSNPRPTDPKSVALIH